MTISHTSGTSLSLCAPLRGNGLPSSGDHDSAATRTAAKNHTAPSDQRLMRGADARIAGSGARDFRQLRVAVLARGAHEPGEQRVAVTRRRGELRVELRRHEPRVPG